MQLTYMRQLLAQKQQQSLYRAEAVTEPLPGGRLRATVDGITRQYLNFSGNDYLGLSADSQLRQIYADAALCYGAASTGSPLVTGYHPVHQALTDELCEWLGVDDVLLLSSGFAANQAMLQALVGEQDLLLLDKLCHASMIDAAMHKPHFQRFLHNDLQSLSQRLSKAQQPCVIATEGVFSMDGDSPDLAMLVKTAGETPVLLDDAHGIGVQGAEGAGSWAAQGLKAQHFQCLMANFGKALAAQGGFLAGSSDVIDFIRQQARHYIYSTALSPALSVLIRATVQRVRTEQWRRDKLQENIATFRALASDSHLPLLASHSAIQPVMMASSEVALAVSQRLKEQGIWVSAIRPPTVPTARLRVTLSAAHQVEDLQVLIGTLQQALQEANV
ncbi:MAG TPA: 8-amino-7-oxononanoate synthase [Rheinheimera sp.]|nr:8-amino-7-oxononanoate synthase [Rheinheimera sp.]